PGPLMLLFIGVSFDYVRCGSIAFRPVTVAFRHCAGGALASWGNVSFRQQTIHAPCDGEPTCKNDQKKVMDGRNCIAWKTRHHCAPRVPLRLATPQHWPRRSCDSYAP